jgi:tetratricopeptide (TPR) repeat protein
MLAALLVAGGYWFWTTPEAPTAAQRAAPPAPQRPAPAAVETAEPSETPGDPEASAAEPELSPTAKRPPQQPPNDSAADRLEQTLRAANLAMTRRDFQKAIEILESIRSSNGTRPEQIDDPLYRANSELAAKKKLGLAQKSLAAGNVDETLRLLDESTGTVAFAKEHAQLKARAEQARRASARKKEKDIKLAQAVKLGGQAPSEDRSPRALEEDPQKLFEVANGQYQKGRFSEAAASLNRCLRADPAFAKCHLLLGSTYAKLREPELGAQHYRRFLQIAPNDPDAARVKTLLEQYDSARSATR